jgi:hypothetical protein
MFERFTERARQVVVLAQEEARLHQRGYIGVEHILLGLIRGRGYRLSRPDRSRRDRRCGPRLDQATRRYRRR